ncbi:hypothetical protein NW767_014775 [Fusarium falciforme]|nr:hypothetical protein NW767_014775 [Fusarium falciforme]KAJ4179748.1 hypothetical protein NW759_017282 [Fusarium solani]
MTDALFGVRKGQLLMKLPGSNDMTSIPVDVAGASKEEQEKRKQNAEASKRHRQKKKDEIVRKLKELQQLQEEKNMWEADRKKMEEDRDYYRDIIKQTPSLSYLVRGTDFLSQTSNTVVRIDDFAARPQSYGGGSSSDERPSKRRRTNQVPEFSTPAYEAFIDRGLRGLPPKRDPRDTSAEWVMSRDAGISTSSSVVASVW